MAVSKTPTPQLLKAKALWATHVCNLAKNNLVKAHKVAKGTLANSITYTIDLKTGAINFIYEDYGQYVQSGRKRGARMPPIKSILEWAKVKKLKGRDKKTGRFITNLALAWAIAMSIKRDGIKKYPFFDMALAAATEQLYSELEDALANDIEYTLNGLSKAVDLNSPQS